MNVWDSVRRLFGANASTPSALRNKPGGMAWIKGLTQEDGEKQLNGRAVKTVAFSAGMWSIEPEQEFIADKSVFYVNLGFGVLKGTVVGVCAIADDCLEPWKDIGDDASDESLWQVPPKREILALPVREMGRPA